MSHRKHGFDAVLMKCEAIIKDMGLNIVYTHNLDPFFKGDLDGKTIFLGYHLSPSEKLFNLLHLAGHSIQWNTDDLLRTMGSELYTNPSDELLRKLQVGPLVESEICDRYVIPHEFLQDREKEQAYLSKNY